MSNIKKIITPLFICAFLLLGAIPVASQTCATICSSGGCTTVLGQSSTGWEMVIDCGGSETYYSGNGDYTGTICNGVEPCNVPDGPENPE